MPNTSVSVGKWGKGVDTDFDGRVSRAEERDCGVEGAFDSLVG